ncbi:alkyl/aryl-sulfatase [Chryseobacterium sp. Ch-15]|uniref:Alkyl/aryl-sulfatase n=1 Tax=Chryseobacterium muglaense TaxID=2893752 RepID=A0A9Q3UTG0_9FLAO|nr:alkyl/aryl-sulfatase [Chryseobacterium muglaense]MBD3906906.1 alkyl/aryl-sulfatase [Chryseobacterium muglaense]MCC9033059.1 alkyl/aryl-sulfatase [Chryseobacterium muglaense]MCM2556603.1 alkyl/aryl-sulfatase [Chryseobacterium muglaense]
MMFSPAMAQKYFGYDTPSTHKHQALDRKITKLSKGIYAFIGYGTSNFGVISTKNGYVLVDVGDNIIGNQEALKEIQKRISGKLQGIILTHSHPDHRGGGKPFLETVSGEVPVWGASNFGSEAQAVKGLENVTAKRAAKQFGIGIPDSLYTRNIMVPSYTDYEPRELLKPNRSAQSGLTKLIIDGVEIELHSVPTETQDHLAVWLPKEKILFSGDAIYGCFPNLYPIRGGTYRDIEQWAAGIRKLMEFKPEAVMLGHRDALTDSIAIAKMFDDNATAIEFVFKETIKGMNDGKTPDELVESIKLPDELREKDYLGEYHGAISWGVREIYATKLGWFDGNATHLVPLSPKEEAKRVSQLAGGNKKLLKSAYKALKMQDYRWAAQLSDYLIELGLNQEGSGIKAKALMEISKDILPITGKNYLIRSALDLEDNIEKNAQ